MSDLHGIIPPMTTPFDDDGKVDLALLRAEATYLHSVGVHGLAVGGSTGEGHTLNTDELRDCVATVCEAVEGEIPVIAGVIVDSTRQAIESGEALSDLNVAALQVTPVHYLFRPTDEAMTRHFSEMCDVVGMPVIIYNVVPWSYCSPDLLTSIIDSIEGVIGVKQSAGDLKLLADLMVQVGDRGRIFSAIDALLYPSFCLGAHGAIGAILAAAPELCVKLWDAVKANDHPTAHKLHVDLLAIWNAIADDNLPANVKTSLELQGRPSGKPRRPMPESSSDQKSKIKVALEKAGVALAR